MHDLSVQGSVLGVGNCKAKVFVNYNEARKRKIGSPDLMVLFTSTVSHKMVK